MHTHTVFFWLKDGTDADRRAEFRHGLEHLAREPHVRDQRIGTPAETRRDVVDWSYAYALVLQFDDLAAHNAYQTSDAHRDFLDRHLGVIDRVQVYDVAEAA